MVFFYFCPHWWYNVRQGAQRHRTSASSFIGRVWGSLPALLCAVLWGLLMKGAKISTMYYSYINSLWHIGFRKLHLSALGNQHQRNAELHTVNTLSSGAGQAWHSSEKQIKTQHRNSVISLWPEKEQKKRPYNNFSTAFGAVLYSLVVNSILLIEFCRAAQNIYGDNLIKEVMVLDKTLSD